MGSTKAEWLALRLSRWGVIGRSLFIVPVVSVAMPMVVVVSVMEIAVMIVVPTMIVLDPASGSGPVTCKKPLPVVMRSNPMRSLIGRSSPVTLMPFVVISNRIPVAFDPCKRRVGLGWRRNINPRWRRRCDQDSDRDLRPNRRHTSEHCP